MSAREIAAVFDERASRYDQNEMHRWLAKETMDAAAPDPRAWVLDVAGGTGLATRGRAERAVVVDLSLGMLAAARLAGAREVVAGDARRLPFRDATFDVVVCVSALPYIADPQAAAAEWRRVCKSSGRAVVTAWVEDGISFPLRLRRAAADYGIVVSDPNAALGRESRLADLLAGAGFADVDVQRRTYAARDGDPELTWTATVDYGFAPALAGAPREVRDRVRQRFMASVRDAPDSSFCTLIAVASR
jgi:SAM-dependent methyltransferase